MGLKELLSEISKQAHQECLRNSCSGDGCRVYLTDVPIDRVIVNLECEFEQRRINTKRCDYVIFYVDASQSCLVVALIELKSGRFKTGEITDQLQKGANFVTELFKGLPREAKETLRTLKITCVPILFHGKGIHKFQLTELERAKVGFFRRNLVIRRRKCGEARNLVSALKG